jgi:hypothetical protein
MTPPTPPTRTATPAARPAGADWIEVAIQWASGAAAVGMFAYGVALSYAVLYAISAAAGLPTWASKLWPLGFEAFMASAALNALAEQRHRRHLAAWQRRVPWYPWTLTALTAGGSILLNWFHPAIPLDPPPGWLVSVVYGLPPLIAVFAWHLFLQRVAHRRQQAHRPAGTVPVPVPQPSVPEADRQDDPTGTAAAGRLAHPVGDRPGGTPPASPSPAGRGGPRPATSQPAGTVGIPGPGRLAQARVAAAEYQRTHGRPISRDALRQALRVSNRTAGALLHQLRAGGTEPSTVAGNGAGGRPAGLATLVPAPVPVPEPVEDGQGVAPDA